MDKLLSEQFYSEVSSSIKLVFDLTSRIDERVKMLVEQQKNMEEHVDKLIEIQQALLQRVAILESKEDEKVDLDDISRRLQALEYRTETLTIKTDVQDGKWNKMLDLIFKAATTVIGAYVLYKMGLPNP